jgi:hypothetical protein
VTRPGSFTRHAAPDAATDGDDERVFETERTVEVPTRGSYRNRLFGRNRAAVDDRRRPVRPDDSEVRPDDGEVRPDTETSTPERVVTPRVRTSALATIALVAGVAGTCAALTGRLAPLAVVAGVVGVLFAIGGLSAVRRPGVTGHGVALFAMLFSLAAIALGGLAMGHAVPWLDSNVNHVTQVRDWLDTNLPWLKGR